jgi:DNA processing protein
MLSDREAVGDREELRAWALLARAPSLNHEQVAGALETVSGAAALVRLSAAKLERLGLPEGARAYLQSPDWSAIEADLAWLKGPDRHLLPLSSAFYPPLLAESGGAPVALYVRGSPALLSTPQLAIVGSRNPTASGRETSRQFAAHLSQCGLTITSGLAEGIDAAAHQGALAAGGITVAVCATGLDRVYPEQHAALADAVAASGALVSEFPPSAALRRSNFPRRNRIISGLSLGALVVEAARYSGSLITARFATEQGREVFAIPGSIHNPLTRGCHRLIREGAKLVETADDILTELRLPPPPSSAEARAGAGAGALHKLGDSGHRRNPGRDVNHENRRNNRDAGEHLPADRYADPAAELDKDYEILLDALGFDPLELDALVERSGLTAAAVASMLLILELRGVVGVLPGGRYCRTSGRTRQ